MYSGNCNGRLLDSRGTRAEHQLSGTAGDLSGSPDIYLHEEEGGDSTAPQQCDNYGLPEQDGWTPLGLSLQTGSKGLELVASQGDSNTCRAPSREGEHPGKLGITPCVGLQQLDAGQGGV